MEDTNGNTAEMTYDNSGNVATVVDGKGNTITTNKYDENNQLISVTDALNVTDTYTYDIMGNVTKVTAQAGTNVEQETTYTYNSDSSLASVKDAENGSSSYTYDKNKNITKVTDPMGGETTYNYDTLNRITKEVNAIGSTHEYTYNAVGLLETYKNSKNQETGAVGNITSATMTYDKANRLTTYNGEAVTYDAEGNITYGPDAQGKMTEYKYNCRNQLIQAGNLTYEYDAEGNRIAQNNAQTSIRTEYVVNTVSELSQVLLATETSKNSEVVENTKATTYVYGNGLITQQSGEEYFVFHYNNIGSTILLTNAKGEPEESYSYGPYGELLSGNRNKTDYLYNGMYGVATDDNGLYYMRARYYNVSIKRFATPLEVTDFGRARYYNVSIKRFINQDVVNGSIINSQSLNKFSYVQGNPIKLTDPFGLSPNISLSGIGHATLNLLGIIPALDFCDAINAAWYFAEGDYANAALCTVAAIPFLGSIAGTGIKWGMKAGTKAEKVAETVKLGSRIAGGAGGFIISGAQALEATKNIHANSGKNGDKSNWSNTADYLTLGLSIAGMGLAGASIAKSGATLKILWSDELAIASAAVSNATKKVINRGKDTIEYLVKDNSGKVDFHIARKSGSKTTKLYRVMTEAEYDSVMTHGKFVPYDRAMEEKWFATTQADATKWADIFYSDGNYRMIEIEVDTDALSQMYYNQHLDNIGPAYCSSIELLESAMKSQKGVR